MLEQIKKEVEAVEAELSNLSQSINAKEKELQEQKVAYDKLNKKLVILAQTKKQLEEL